MSIEVTVWAFKPLKELHEQIGFVACDSELASKLIEAGEVQDPAVGGLHLKAIEAAAVEPPHEPHEPHEGEHEYETTHLMPRPPKRRK